MKIITLLFNILRWIIGIILMLTSIGGFISGDYLTATIVLVIGALILPIVTNKLFNRNSENSFSTLNLFQDMNFGQTNKIVNSLDFNNKENLIADINNQINLSKKPINDKNKYTIGKQIYFKALQNCLIDLNLSETEKKHLEEIISNFNLTKFDILNAKNKLSTSTVQKLIQKSYDDKILTENEKDEIVNLAEYLELPKDKVETIRVKIASSLLQTALNEKLSDKRLSPKEESELNQILNDLQIQKDQINSILPKKSLDELAFAKLLWSLDNGAFYSIPNPQITLRKSEECYLGYSSKLLESKIIHKGYSSSSQGVSIPIMKGVRYRVGSSRSVPIKEQVTIKHPGSLFLTNLRIVFSSGSKSFEIPFTKLLSFKVYTDGIEFMLQNKNFMVQLNSKEIELFAVGMTSSIRNYLDGENQSLKNAMKEIEENEKFIVM